MRHIKIISLFVFACLLGVLDFSFFAFLDISGTTVIASLAAILVFALLGSATDLLILSVIFSLLFSAFSSLSPISIVCLFWLIPGLTIMVKKTYLQDVSIFVTLIILIFVYLLVGITIAVGLEDWGTFMAQELGKFILVNLFFCLGVYWTGRKLQTVLGREEIKI